MSKIKYSDLLLKKLSLNDYSTNYLNWMNDKKAQEFTEQKYIKHTKTDVINFIKSKKNSKTEKVYGIFLLNKNKKIHIGNIKLGPIDIRHKML
jgi:hypothetical protein